MNKASGVGELLPILTIKMSACRLEIALCRILQLSMFWPLQRSDRCTYNYARCLIQLLSICYYRRYTCKIM